MKRFLTLLALSSITFFSAYAQNSSYPWGASFKSLFLDYQSQVGGSIDAIRNYHHGFEIGISRRLQDNVYLSVPIKFGHVNKGRLDGELACLHKDVLGIDGQLQYQFQKPAAKIVPYILGGIGAAYEFGDGVNIQAPLGVGMYFKAAQNMYVNWQSEYRFSFAEDRNNLHHGIGFTYLWGGGNQVKVEEPTDNDKDGDGIENDLDLCPDVAGLKALNGCPDSDGDGIADFNDKCPTQKGNKAMMGCPDSDNDGVIDADDKCPNEAGTKDNNGCPIGDRDNDGVKDNIDKCPDIAGDVNNSGCPSDDNDEDGVPNAQDRCPDSKGSAATNGCPDTDGDGVADADDKCPKSPGPKVYNGCPDSDGDGLDDSIDKCPNTPGTVAGGGCPEITKEDRQTLDIAMRAVQFDLGKATLKTESFAILKQVSSILNRYPDYNLIIAGHTDNTGSAAANQDLSERRAKACFDYLISQGVAASRMSHNGYGDSRPVADNTTLNGRTLNRRVEFNMVPR